MVQAISQSRWVIGQTSKVEEAMNALMKEAQSLVNCHVVKSANSDLCTKLEETVKEMGLWSPLAAV